MTADLTTAGPDDPIPLDITDRWANSVASKPAEPRQSSIRRRSTSPPTTTPNPAYSFFIILIIRALSIGDLRSEHVGEQRSGGTAGGSRRERAGKQLSVTACAAGSVTNLYCPSRCTVGHQSFHHEQEDGPRLRHRLPQIQAKRPSRPLWEEVHVGFRRGRWHLAYSRGRLTTSLFHQLDKNLMRTAPRLDYHRTP